MSYYPPPGGQYPPQQPYGAPPPGQPYGAPPPGQPYGAPPPGQPYGAPPQGYPQQQQYAPYPPQQQPYGAPPPGQPYAPYPPQPQQPYGAPHAQYPPPGAYPPQGAYPPPQQYPPAAGGMYPPAGAMPPGYGYPAPVAVPQVPMGMPMPGGMPLGGPIGGPYTVQSDAERLYYAMRGLGTDDSELIEIVGGRPRAHLNAVAKAYEARHGHELKHDIKGDTSFHYKELLVALVKPVGEYMADLIHDAVSGPGTKEKELIDVITQVNPAELAVMKDTWQRKHSGRGSLEHCLSGETSFNFRRTLLHSVRGTRMPPGAIDQSRVMHDEELLYRAGEKRWGTDDDTFIELISRSSAEHLQAVSAEYARRHGHSLERAIEKETSGDYRDALIALCTPRHVWVAKRVHDAVCGVGTNDSLLIRMFSFNDKPQLMLAAQTYEQMFHKSMAHDVAKDTSGDYKKLLLRLLRP